MLTIDHGVFRCSLKTAEYVAECANLRCEVSCDPSVGSRYRQFSVYSLWEDTQTGGGGARIVWSKGYAWVSRHSGYAWADITEEVRELFRELGAEPLGESLSYELWSHNPHIRGSREWEDYLQHGAKWNR
jgi:hypothetical protein